jgi:hypothetical protein
MGGSGLSQGKSIVRPSLKSEIVFPEHGFRAGRSHGNPHPTAGIDRRAWWRSGCVAARHPRADRAPAASGWLAAGAVGNRFSPIYE